MKRLIKTCGDEEFLGQFIEIIYPKSRFNGYRGWIGNSLIKGKFRISLPPATYEEREQNYIFYVEPENIYKWVRIVRKNVEEEEDK